MAGKKLDFGDRFAVMAWFQALSLRLAQDNEELSAGKIGKRYILDISSSDNSSKIFYKYRSGDSFPDQNRMLFPMKFMDLELDWLFGEMFSLLNKGPIPQITLPHPLFDYLYSDCTRGIWLDLQVRDDSDWLERFDLVRNVGGLDAFIATLAMIRQCFENKRMGGVYLRGCGNLLGLWREVYFHPVLGPFADNLFDFIEDKYLPAKVPSLSEENDQWITVSEHKKMRHKLAMVEHEGWDPSKAKIPTRWLERYLGEKELRRKAINRVT